MRGRLWRMLGELVGVALVVSGVLLACAPRAAEGPPPTGGTGDGTTVPPRGVALGGPYDHRKIVAVERFTGASPAVWLEELQRRSVEVMTDLDSEIFADVTDGGPEHARIVAIYSSNVSDVWRANLFPDLAVLDLLLCTGGDDAIEMLDSDSIQSLYLPIRGTTDAGIRFLRRIPTDVAWNVVPELRHLGLAPKRGGGLTPKALKFAGEIAKLESLQLTGWDVTAEWITGVSEMRKLRGLALYMVVLRAEDLDPLARMPNLTHLRIAQCDVPETVVARLKALPALEELHLEGGQFTDACVKELSQMPRLRVLVLDNTTVTDEGIQILRRMPNLEFISALGTTVSKAALEAWQAENPGLRRFRLMRKDPLQLDGWIRELRGRWICDAMTFPPSDNYMLTFILGRPRGATATQAK